MHRKIEISLSQDDVLAIYERHKTGRTKLQTPQFRDTWNVGMPPEFGATDPILYIQFDPASRVSAVAMRTSDGIHLDPPPGFPDKGSFHMPTQETGHQASPMEMPSRIDGPLRHREGKGPRRGTFQVPLA